MNYRPKTPAKRILPPDQASPAAVEDLAISMERTLGHQAFPGSPTQIPELPTTGPNGSSQRVGTAGHGPSFEASRTHR